MRHRWLLWSMVFDLWHIIQLHFIQIILIQSWFIIIDQFFVDTISAILNQQHKNHWVCLFFAIQRGNFAVKGVSNSLISAVRVLAFVVCVQQLQLIICIVWVQILPTFVYKFFLTKNFLAFNSYQFRNLFPDFPRHLFLLLPRLVAPWSEKKY